MKNLKSITFTLVIAIGLGFFINSFILSTAKVSAKSLTPYNENDRLVINHLAKNFNVGDNILIKENNDYLVRTIKDINKDFIVIVDKNNNSQTIDIKTIIGKVVYKF